MARIPNVLPERGHHRTGAGGGLRPVVFHRDGEDIGRDGQAVSA